MSIFESLMVSLYGMTVVFVVLIVLSFLVKLQSVLFSSIGGKKKTALQESGMKAGTEDGCIVSQENNGVSFGDLKLIGVDEKTAAMIMAIVSDESKIPLSELQFKTIKAID